MREERFYPALASPLFIAAVALLLLNDFYIKSEYPGFLSGKLSDVAGLFAFPLFFALFFPQRKLAIYIATALGFILWKLPAADGAISMANTFLPFPIARVADYSDYWALLILPLSYIHEPRWVVWEKSKFFRGAIAIVACFAFCATSWHRPALATRTYIASHYQLERYVDSVFAGHPEMRVPVESFREFINSGYMIPGYDDEDFECCLVDEQGAEIFGVSYLRGEFTTIEVDYIRREGEDVRPLMRMNVSEEERERIDRKFENEFIAKLNRYIRPRPKE